MAVYLFYFLVFITITASIYILYLTITQEDALVITSKDSPKEKENNFSDLIECLVKLCTKE